MRFACSLLLCSLITSVFAQVAGSDSAILKQASQYALARYEQLDGGRDRLYNGYEYVGYDPRIRGHSFFEDNNWQNGSVLFDGRAYSAVPMLYDIVRDVVVIEHGAGFRMTMRSDQVKTFSLLNHTFVRLSDTTSQGFRTGFYDLLYDGPTQLLARRTKTILINPSVTSGFGEFDAKAMYYIHKGNHYYPVKNKKTLLAVLTDHKQELVSYARKQKIRFRPDPEPAILALTQQYDKLSN